MSTNSGTVNVSGSMRGDVSIDIPRMPRSPNIPDASGYPGIHTWTLQELLKGSSLPKEVMIQQPDGSYRVDPEKLVALYKSKMQPSPLRFPAIPKNPSIPEYLKIGYKNPYGSVTLGVDAEKLKGKIPVKVDVRVNGVAVSDAIKAIDDRLSGKIRKALRTATSLTKDDVVDATNKVTNNAVKTTSKEIKALGDHFMNRLSDSAAHGLKVGAGTVAGGAAGNILSHALLGEEGPHTAITLLTAIASGIATNKLLKKYPNVV